MITATEINPANMPFYDIKTMVHQKLISIPIQVTVARGEKSKEPLSDEMKKKMNSLKHPSKTF